MNQLIEHDTAQITHFNSVQNEVEKSRALQEVQGAIVMARKFPRDEFVAMKKILEAAKRITLAEKAIYMYPRGGQQIKGASIRTAETIAKYWGNLSFGIKELTQNTANHTSEVMAYAWDLESNVRQERIFKVQIYEKVANDGARRLRACILGILPSDVVEDFLTECEKTLEGSSEKPLKERIKDMLKKFEELGVTKEMIEKRIGTKTSNFIAKNIVDLGSVYNSIKNNFAPVEQYFDMPTLAETQIEASTLKVEAQNETDK